MKRYYWIKDVAFDEVDKLQITHYDKMVTQKEKIKNVFL